jgi:hypothetical protein
MRSLGRTSDPGAVEANRDQLARSDPFDLRRPHGTRQGWSASRATHENAAQVDPGHSSDSMGVTKEAQSDDIDPDEVTEVFLYAAVFLCFLLVVAVGAAVVFALSALRHW